MDKKKFRVIYMYVILQKYKILIKEDLNLYVNKCYKIKIRSHRLLLKELMKPHIKVKSGELFIMHDHIVMPRRKLSSDWLNTHVTKQGFVRSFSNDLRKQIKGFNFI